MALTHGCGFWPRLTKREGMGEAVGQWRVPDELALANPREREQRWFGTVYGFQLLAAMMLVTAVVFGPGNRVGTLGIAHALGLLVAWALLIPPPKRAIRYLMALRKDAAGRLLRVIVCRNGIIVDGGRDNTEHFRFLWRQAACVAFAPHPSVEGVTALVAARRDGHVVVAPMPDDIDTVRVERALEEARGGRPVARMRHVPRHQTRAIAEEMLFAWPSAALVKAAQSVFPWRGIISDTCPWWFMSTVSPWCRQSSQRCRRVGSGGGSRSRRARPGAGSDGLGLVVLLAASFAGYLSRRVVVCADRLVVGTLTIPWAEAAVSVRRPRHWWRSPTLVIDWDCGGVMIPLEMELHWRFDVEGFEQAMAMAHAVARA